MNCETGLLSWIIVKYESHTRSDEPNKGFIGLSTSHSVVTTSYLGEIIVGIENGVLTELGQRLWVEGNLPVDYVGKLQ